MKNVRENTLETDETLETLLTEAGFDFVVVDRCPEQGCHFCNQVDISVAA